MNWKNWLVKKLGGYSETEMVETQQTMQKEIDHLCNQLRENCIEMARHITPEHTIELKATRHIHKDEDMQYSKTEIAADLAEEMLKENVISFTLTPAEENQYYDIYTGTVRCYSS